MNRLERGIVMAQGDHLRFCFGVDAVAFTVTVPRVGEDAHYIEAFGVDGKFIGIARFVPPPDAAFNVWLNQDGSVNVTFH